VVVVMASRSRQNGIVHAAARWSATAISWSEAAEPYMATPATVAAMAVTR
jgi:hypothetical protein